MNLAMISKASFITPLHLTFNPTQLNFIMQCLSLNLSYTDNLDHYFWFVQDCPLKAVGNSKSEISANCTKVTLVLLNTENKEVAELSSRGLKIDNAIYYNEESKTTLRSSNMVMKDYDVEGRKVHMAYPRSRSEKENFIVLGSASFKKRKDCVVNNYRWKITIKNYVYAFRLNTMYSLLQVLKLSLPDYETIPFKPNNCTAAHKP